METKNKNLYYLEELSDYKVASDDPDVRGWRVKDVSGRVVGKVDNLLVNKNTERVVYLDVELDASVLETNYKPYSKSASNGVHDFINKEGENHVIIPIGMATLNKEDEYVITNKINHRTFSETKRFKKSTPLYRDYEVIILDSYLRDHPVDEYPEDDTFYDREEFNY